MSVLAKELSLQVIFHVNKTTEKSIQKLLKTNHLNIPVQYIHIDNWEDAEVLHTSVQKEDLFVIVSARRVSVSSAGMPENLPSRLERHFEHNSRMIIYPKQYDQGTLLTESYEDVSLGPISKGIEAVRMLGKELKDVFKKEEKE